MKHNNKQLELLEPSVIDGWEGFAKGLDRLSRELGELNERWNNGLALHKFMSAEDYIDPRLTFVLEICSRFGVDPEWRCLAAVHLKHIDTIAVPERDVPYFGDPCCGNDKVVLIPIREIVESRQRHAAAICKVSMRFYRVPKQGLRLFDGPTYRSLFNGRYEALPVGGNWQRVFVVGDPGSAYQAHPGIVERGSEIANDIANQERDNWWDWPGEAEFERIAVALRFNSDRIGFFFDESLGNLYEMSDQFLGPLDL